MGSEKNEINPFDLWKIESGNYEGESTKIANNANISDIPFKDEEEGSEEETEEVDIETEDSEDTSEESEEGNSEDTEEESSEEQEEEEVGVYSTFANALIENDTLIPLEGKEYDESDEGIAELVEDTVETKYNQRIEALESLQLTEKANLKDLVNFIEAGGDPREFLDKTIGSIDYREVEVTTDEEDVEGSIATQKQILRDKLTLEEYTEEEIEDTISDFEKADTLEKQAKLALKVLIKKQDEEYTEMLRSQEIAKQNRIELAKKQDEELKNTIYSKSNIAGFEWTEKEKEKFYKFLTVPVKKDANGNMLTQYQLESLDLDKRLELAFLQFKGGISAVENKVEKKKNLKLKETLSRFAKEDKNTRKSTDNFDEEVSSANKNKGKLKINFPHWM